MLRRRATEWISSQEIINIKGFEREMIENKNIDNVEGNNDGSWGRGSSLEKRERIARKLKVWW